ncbi:hypothetical protein ACOMHN_025177 [Nucella lapillus]
MVNNVIMTSSQTSVNVTTTTNNDTTTTPQISPISTILTTIVRDAVSSTATSIQSSSKSWIETTSSPGFPGVVSERLYIFVGIFIALVFIAVSIVVYIKRVHERRPERDPFSGTIKR